MLIVGSLIDISKINPSKINSAWKEESMTHDKKIFEKLSNYIDKKFYPYYLNRTLNIDNTTEFIYFIQDSGLKSKLDEYKIKYHDTLDIEYFDAKKLIKIIERCKKYEDKHEQLRGLLNQKKANIKILSVCSYS